MKKLLMSLALAAGLLIPTLATAQETTLVADGTSTNNYVPVYGLWVDDYTRSQMIYPATMLDELTPGSEISALTFFSSTASQNWGAATFEVRIGEVSETTLSSFLTYTSTTVYTGAVTVSDSQMDITFTTPYTYMGGNLMVEFYQTVTGTYHSTYFYGVTATGASGSGYNSSSAASATFNQRDFLPKMEIEYTPGSGISCYKVKNLAATDITSDEITLTWLDTSNSNVTYSVAYWTATGDTNEVTATDTFVVVSGLEASTQYYFAVTPNCTEGTASAATCTAQTDCDGGGCTVVIDMVDSYGDGWNGAAINGIVNGVSTFTATISDGYTGTYNYAMCNSDTVQLTWTPGSYPGETSFTISIGGAAIASGSGSSYSSGAVVVTLEGCPACPAPANFVLDSVSPDEAIFHWTAGDEETEWVVEVNGTDTYNTTSPEITLTDLSPNTAYTVTIKAVCDEESNSMALNAAFRTACGDIAIPYTEDFEGMEASAAPSCWTVISGNPNVVSSTSNAHDGSQYLRFAGANVNAVAIPPVDQPVSELQLRFWVRPEAYTNSSCGRFSVGYMTDLTVDSSFVAIVTWSYNAWTSNTYEEKEVLLNTVPEGATVVLRQDSCSTNWYWFVDDFVIEPIPACPRPTAVSASNISDSEADITVTGVDDLSYRIYWTADGTTVDSADMASSPYTITGLSANTLYTVTAVSVCEDGSTTASVSTTFRTACSGYTPIPYTEGFENLATGEMPGCWMQVATGTSGSGTFPSAYSHAPNTHTGSGYFEFEANSTGGDVEMAALPMMENISTLRLSMWVASTSSYPCTLEVGVLEADNSFTVVDTIDLITFSGTSGWSNNYHEYVTYFNDYSGDGERIALRVTRTTTGQFTLFVDDLNVTMAGSAEITYLPASAVANLGDPLNVTATVGGDMSSMTYTWSSIMANAGNATMSNVDNALTITYSTVGVDTVTFVASNSLGSDTAMMEVHVMDLNPVTTFPYTTGFEAGDDVNWIMVNDINNMWFVGSATANGGTNSLYISNDNGTSNAYNTSGGQFSYAYRVLSFSEAGQYAVSFDWKAEGESNWDYMRAWLAPATAIDNLNAGYTPAGGTNAYGYTSATPAGWIDLGGKMNLQDSWQTATAMPSVSAGNYIIVFMWANDGSGGTNPPAAVDNIVVTPLTCPAPTALGVDSVTASEITVHWTAGGEETAWSISVNDSIIYNVTSPYTITDLNQYTWYDIAVYAVCGADDTSFASQSISVRTLVACPWPTDLAANVTGDTVVLSWNPGDNSNSEYQVVYGPSGFNPDTASNIIVVSDATTTEIDDLTAGLYHAYVRSDCGSSNSVWAGPVSFGLGYVNINQVDTLHTCGAIICDDGGPNGNYGNSQDHQVVIYPVDATHGLNISGHSQTEGSFDYLTIYEGVGTSGTVLFCDNTSSVSTDLPVGPFEVFGPVTITFHSDMSVNYAGFEIGVSCFDLTGCIHPWGVTATSVFSDNVTVAFNGSGTGNYILTITDSASYSNTVNVSGDSTYTFTGLTPLTTYYISVVSDCGNGEISTPTSIVVTTTAVPTALPYSTGFETGDDTGWMLVNGTQTNQWVIDTAASNTGSHALYISNDNGVSNSYSHTASSVYACKLLSFDSIGDYIINYDWRANGESCCDYLRVLLAPSTADLTAGSNSGITTTGAPAGWIALDGANKLNVQTSWQNRTETFTVTNPGNYQLVFYWRNDGSVGTNPPAAVDNVQVGRLSCPAPQNIEFDDINGSTATFHWTPAGSESEWEVTFDGVSTIVNTPDYTVSGLSAMSGYTVSVRAVCGDGDTSFATSINFATPCATVTDFPWIEDFENESTFMCWSQTGDSEWEHGTGDNNTSTGAHSGSYNALITHNDDDDVTMLISPVLALSGDNAMLSFWHLQRVWSGDQDELRVYYRTSESDNWNLLATYTNDIQTWTKDSVVLPNLSATYQIGFEMTDQYGHGVAIDDIMVTGEGGGISVCAAPTITSTTATETTATVTFESDAALKQVAIVTGNVNAAAFANATAIDVTGNSHTFNGLTPGAAYTIGVRAVCSDDNISEWTLSHVTTDDHPCLMPTDVTVSGLSLDGATISWTPAESTQTNFEVRVYNNTFDQTYTVQGNTLTVTNLFANVTYYVEVRAVCGEGFYSDWTAAVDFTTADCTAPSNVNATVDGRNVTVSWQSTGADRYRVVYFDEFTPADDATTVEVENGATTVTVTVPEGGRMYNFYVFAYCGDALSTPSDVAEVEILSIGTVSISEVTLYPNPASTTVTVSGIEGESTVTVVDMNGRTVYTNTTNSDLTIDLTGMAKGAYFVRITGEQATAVRKLIVK